MNQAKTKRFQDFYQHHIRFYFYRDWTPTAAPKLMTSKMRIAGTPKISLIFQYNVDNLINSLFKEMDREKTALDRLLGLPRAYGKRYRQIIDYGGCPILNTATEADDTHEALCRLTINAIARLKQKLTSR